MRITVGHILIIGAIGAGGYFYATSSSNWVSNKTKALKEEALSLFGLFKSGEKETRTSRNEPAPVVPSKLPDPEPLKKKSSSLSSNQPAPTGCRSTKQNQKK